MKKPPRNKETNKETEDKKNKKRREVDEPSLQKRSIQKREAVRFEKKGGAKRSPQKEVVFLFGRELNRRGYPKSFLSKLEGFWWEFCRSEKPKIKKPAIYAASMEYYFSMEEPGAPTQRDLALVYGVNASSISRVAHRIHSFCRKVLDGISTKGTSYKKADGLEPTTGQKPSKGGGDVGGKAGDVEREQRVVLDDATKKVFLELEQVDEVWVGGRRATYNRVMEPEPHFPDATIWLIKDSGLVVGADLFHPSADHEALLRSLLRGMLEPMVGDPRRPARILVDDESLCRRYSPALNALSIDIGVGDTKPVDKVMKVLQRQSRSQGLSESKAFSKSRKLSQSRTRSGAQKLSESTKVAESQTPSGKEGFYPDSYLDQGLVDEKTIARFFRSAARLVRVAPWALVSHSQVLDVTLGRWNADHRCVSILGAGGAEKGLILLNSVDDFRRYVDKAETASMTDGGFPLLDVSVLALSFDSPAKLSAQCQKETMQHGWEVEAADAYPWLLKVDPANQLAPLSERDYEIASACADAVSGFVERHQGLFKEKDPQEVTDGISLPEWPNDSVEVTAPLSVGIET